MIYILIFIMTMTIECDDPAMAEKIQFVYDEAVEQIEKDTGYAFHGSMKIQYPADDYSYMSYSYGKILPGIKRIVIHLSVNWQAWEFWHEMGHVMFIQLYDYRQDYLPDIEGHNWNRDLWAETTAAIALWEGWATYFQVVASGKRSEILEQFRWYNQAIPIDVASALYHLRNRARLFSFIDKYHPQTLNEVLGRYTHGRMAIVWSRFRKQ